MARVNARQRMAARARISLGIASIVNEDSTPPDTPLSPLLVLVAAVLTLPVLAALLLLLLLVPDFCLLREAPLACLLSAKRPHLSSKSSSSKTACVDMSACDISVPGALAAEDTAAAAAAAAAAATDDDDNDDDDNARADADDAADAGNGRERSCGCGDCVGEKTGAAASVCPLPAPDASSTARSSCRTFLRSSSQWQVIMFWMINGSRYMDRDTSFM